MAKELNKVSVNLSFSADTNKAKQQLAELDKLLTNLGAHAAKSNSLGLDKELTQAVSKAAELKSILASSTTETGKLDLGKFNSELNKSNVKLKDYASSLVSLGPQGEQAFIQLARSISAAEVPLKRSNAMLREFATTLKNTARWQISSSMLHAFMGTLQSAYGYAQDLNESLNNIRIVTGQSTDEMARFAKEANRAAKELNTTTTKYSDAALIYYQQGLSDKQVKERTDVTIKMANVARESATEVSSYMTAIWNNFDKEGTQSLEHFGDVITALGAATAASTEEIAHGLEKFAAVADTIGLSYEYATSAIATIVDKTRQSEDVVGTALKTIFARIQGLSLGETLDDGTSLNKYSEALASVGISIFDSVGELKNMDTILDEMGAKWQLLSKDQQVALAQTVAGVRQYNQLVSLMDNYDAFKGNVDIAKNSDGALQGQADIYAESWEAARDRVKAAAEGLYDSLLDDDFFITLLNGFEKLLTTVENFIDGIGGMGGAILLAGSLLFKYFGPDVAKSINNGLYNMTLSGEKGFQKILDLRKEANKELKKVFAESVDNDGDINSPANVKGDIYEQEANLQDALLVKKEELAKQGKELNEIEERKLQILLDETRALGEQAIKSAEMAKKAKKQEEDSSKDLVGRYSKQFKDLGKGNLRIRLDKASEKEKKFARAKNLYDKYLNADESKKFKGTEEEIKQLRKTLNLTKDEFKAFQRHCEGCAGDSQKAMEALWTTVEDLGEASQSAFDSLEKDTGNLKGFDEQLHSIQQQAHQVAIAENEVAEATENYGKQVEEVEDKISNAKEKAYDFGDCVGALGEMMMSAFTAMSAIKGLGDLWSDEDVSLGEKLVATVTTLATIVPLLTTAYSKQNWEKAKSIILTGAEALGIEVENKKLTKQIVLETALALIKSQKSKIILAIVAAMTALIAVIALVNKSLRAEAEAQERANQVAEEAEQKYQNLKTAYEELKNSIEDYNGALKAFQELEKGADGYAEALANVNDQARKLIEENGLYNDWHYGEGGVIEFNDGVLAGLENHSNEAQLRAGATAAATKISATQKQKDGIYNTYGKTLVDNGDGTFTYALDENKVKTLNTLGELTQEQFESLLDYSEKLGTEHQINSEEFSKATGIASDSLNDLTTMMKTMGSSVESNYKSIKNLNNVLDYQIENQALKNIQRNGMFNGNANAQNAYANLLAQDAGYQNQVMANSRQASGISKNNLRKLLNNDGFNAGSGLSDTELAKAYAQYVEGWTEDQIRESSFKDKELKSGENSITVEDKAAMREAIASAILSEQLSTQIGNEEFDSQLKADIAKLQELSNNVSNVTLNALSNYESGGEIKLDSSLLSPEDIEELRGTMDDIGSEFGAALTEAIDNYDESKYWDRLEAQQSANIDNQIATEGLDADVVATQTELIMENTEALEDNENAAKQLAVNNTRMNKGVETLIDNWDDWNKTLKEGDKTSEEYAKTITEMRSCLGDLVGLTDNLEGSLSTSFFDSAENLELMERAANADTEAIRELGNAVAQDLAKGMEIADEFVNVFDEADAKLTFGDDVYTSLDQLQVAFGTAKANVLSVIDEISQAELKLGDDLASAIGDDDMQKFVDGLNQMAIMTNMSVADMQAMLNSLGVEANVTETWVPETVSVPVYTIERKPDTDSWDESLGMYTRWTESSAQTDVTQMEGGRMVASIQYSEDGSKSGKPQVSYVGHGNVSTGNKTKAADAAKKRSGGSDKKKKSEKGKTQKEEVDRYHEIKEVLEDLGRELDRLGKKKDRAWGAGKLAAINAETQALQKQIGALKNYHSQISANLGTDRANASKYGWSFDGNGNVSNYEGTLAGLINEYNAAVAAFNSSAQEEADQERLDKAKEHYEEAKEALSQYEETKDLYEDVLDQITEASYALADAQLEAIEYSVEIKLELDDNQLKLLEDIMATIGDSAARAVDSIELIEKSIDTVFNQMETSKEGIKSLLDYIGLEGDIANRILNGGMTEGDKNSLAEILNSYGGAIDMDRVVQDLQEYQDNLLAYNEQLRNYRDQVFDTVNNAFTEYLEDFDRVNDRIAHTVKLTQGYKDLISAIGKANIDVTGKLTKQLNQALQAEAEDAYRAAIAKEEFAQNAYQKALEGYNTALATGDEYAIRKWTEILESAQDELQAAQEDSQAAMTEWANAIATSFQESIQQVIQDLDTALGGLTHLREQFDQAQEIDAQYLDDYEKIYELSKLTREVQKSIDETDNVAAKKTLMEYQEKINAYQKEGVEMSQYELDYLRAQYDLEMAKIAMEEAANAKSQVTMTRDAEGNYSYVYTADDAAVESAEQTYEDRLFAMQQLNAQYINDLQSNILTMQEEMSAKLEEIANNDLLSYEEKQIRMQEITDYYTDRIRYYNEQLTVCIDNNKVLYEDEWTDYHNKTGYKISANEDYVDSWEETTLGILTNVESQEEYMEQLEAAINHAKEEAVVACDEAMDALDEAGMTAEELGETIADVTDDLVNDAEEAANSAEEMADEYSRSYDEITNAAISFTATYASLISQTISQNQMLITSMQEVMRTAIQMQNTLNSVGGSNGGYNGGGTGPGGGGTDPGDIGGPNPEDKVPVTPNPNKGGPSYWCKSRSFDTTKQYVVIDSVGDLVAKGTSAWIKSKWPNLPYKEIYHASFNTGGYTGSWTNGDKQGKLAWLHQKELVLNADDTSNMLNIIDMVRKISNTIDINALSSMMNSGLVAASAKMGENNALEQNVHITAEFPNATDKHEILEAFDNVINLAAQYANRK